MADLIGQHLGQYEITALLGEGGMAAVYRARQATVKRDVAVKVIKPNLIDKGDFIKRFEREAQTVAALSHPFILKVFDYGQQGDLVFLVMELLIGGSLADLIRRGPLSPDMTTRVFDQVASALDYAHQKGIIHRDLKPQNVLLDEAGNAHLTDFGIAKILAETTALTQSGMAMGTPTYMAPEQWQGRALDARADIYALGVMLFEMLTGRLPFIGDTPASLMYMHLQEPPPPIRSLRPDVPPGVEGVIQKALAKDREQRFSSTREMVTAFRAGLTGQASTSATHVEMPLSKPIHRTPFLVGGGALTVGLLIGLFAVLSGLSGGRNQPTRTSTAPVAAAIQATTPTTPTIAVTTTAVAPSSVLSSAPVPPTTSPGSAPNVVTRAAATLAARATLTANAAATLHEEETTGAIVAGTETAMAVTAFTPPPATSTPTLTETAEATWTPTVAATFTPTSDLKADFTTAWQGSAHARKTDEPFMHWNADGRIPAACAVCHSTTGLTDFLGADKSMPGVVEKDVSVGEVITCNACHNTTAQNLQSVRFPSGVSVNGLGRSSICGVCHQGRASKVQVDNLIAVAGLESSPNQVSDRLPFLNVHYFAAAASLYGGDVHGGYEFAGKTYVTRYTHTKNYDTCTGCHDAHSLQVKADQCGACHKGVKTTDDLRNIRKDGPTIDYDGDGNNHEGIAAEIEGLKAILYTTMRDYAKKIAKKPIAYHIDNYPYFFIDTNDNGKADPDEVRAENAYHAYTPRLLQAAYNYQANVKDPGAFAHNPTYELQLLYDSIEALDQGLGVGVGNIQRAK